MKATSILVFVLLLFLGCTGGGAPDATAWQASSVSRSADVEVHAFFDPDPPGEKGNRAWLQVTRGGTPVTEAPAVQVIMPAMGTMAEMRSTATVKAHGGVFAAEFDLPMTGSWTLDVAVGGTHVPFTFTTGAKGLVGESSGPTTASASGDGGVPIDADRRQQYGIRTVAAVTKPLQKEVRGLGQVAWDETSLRDVTMTFDGYVRNLRVAQTGQTITRGQTLFDVYSPELVTAQNQFLLVNRQRATSGDPLAEAARRNLSRLGMSDARIDELAARGTASEAVPFASPASGYVVEKDVVEGSAFAAGDRLYRLAPLDHVWVEASVYADDAAGVRTGNPAQIRFAHGDQPPIDGTVRLIVPTVDPLAHTVTVRIDVANAEGALLPGMYADVILPIDLGQALVVPASAVIYTGPRHLVFVDTGDGRLVPRAIEVGLRVGDDIVVRSGLAEGDRVVATGTFLVAAESRIRSTSDLWEAADGG